MKKYIWSFLGLAAVALVAFLASSIDLQKDEKPVVDIEKTVRVLKEAGRPLVYHKLFGVERVTVVNMIPNAQSDETGQDSEPNLAVDPSDTSRIVGSAFTENPSGNLTSAPIFISTDAGTTWAMNNLLPSGNGMTGDISLDFAREDHTLYTGILRGGSYLRMMILRSGDPFGSTMMTTLRDYSSEDRDQPYMTATTTEVSGVNNDRVYAGFNDLDNGGNGRTASVEYSLDARTAAAPAGFSPTVVETRNAYNQDMPAVRWTVHGSGVVYGIFYRWVSDSTPNPKCDVIVVRDDNFGSGTNPFTALTDPGDSIAGRIVVSGRIVPAFYDASGNMTMLGHNRLVASNLSIAVNPKDSAVVYIAWADSDYTLHVRRSTDSGANWSSDLIKIKNATNPALAITTSGRVGYLYQQLTGSDPNYRWETHLRRSNDGKTWSDMILADTPDNDPAPAWQPYIGDYCDLIAVGGTFYGIFSASNIPDSANFPQGVTYQRNADFTTKKLRNGDNTADVDASIDPFFFKITPPSVIDYCDLYPNRCQLVELERGRLILEVQDLPFVGVDPVSKNCLVKWDCPGCGGGGFLCPPYYHIYLEDINPADWEIQLLTKFGDPANYRLTPIKTGLVLSFRPSSKLYREKEIGDYYLAFESKGDIQKRPYVIRTKLEVSDFPFDEHLMRQKDIKE